MSGIQSLVKAAMLDCRAEAPHRCRSAAIHEAGHALALWWNGLRIFYATVPTELESQSDMVTELNGQVQGSGASVVGKSFKLIAETLTPEIVLDTPSLAGIIHREVLICYAGPVAEAASSGASLTDVMLRGGGQMDLQCAYDAMQVLPEAWRGLVDVTAERRARELVSRYWPAISALADLLQVAGTVGGETVNALLEVTTGETPGFMQNALTDLDVETQPLPADAGEGGKDGR